MGADPKGIGNSLAFELMTRSNLFLGLALTANSGLLLLATPAAPIGVALLLVATPAAVLTVKH